eukprot:284814-Prorocentrum_minimum.AAC.2
MSKEPTKTVQQEYKNGRNGAAWLHRESPSKGVDARRELVCAWPVARASGGEWVWQQGGQEGQGRRYLRCETCAARLRAWPAGPGEGNNNNTTTRLSRKCLGWTNASVQNRSLQSSETMFREFSVETMAYLQLFHSDDPEDVSFVRIRTLFTPAVEKPGTQACEASDVGFSSSENFPALNFDGSLGSGSGGSGFKRSTPFFVLLKPRCVSGSATARVHSSHFFPRSSFPRIFGRDRGLRALSQDVVSRGSTFTTLLERIFLALLDKHAPEDNPVWKLSSLERLGILRSGNGLLSRSTADSRPLSTLPLVLGSPSREATESPWAGARFSGVPSKETLRVRWVVLATSHMPWFGG